MEVDVTTTDQQINHNEKLTETGSNSDIGHSSRKNDDITVDDDDDDDDDNHDVDSGDAVALECPYCQRKDFTSVGPLAAHIRTSHSRPSDNLFACDVCGLAFSTVAKLDQHRDEQHPAELIVAKSEPISLSSPATTNVDGPTPKSTTSLLLTDDGVARFMCNFCPVHFYDEATRATHEQTIHLSRRCHVDGGGGSSSGVFQLSASGGLTDSVSPAMASTAVFCSQCSLGFPHIYALADHMHHSHGYNNRTPGSTAHPVDMSSLTSPITKSPTTAVVQSAFDSTSASSKSNPGGRREPVKPTAVRADSVELRQPPRGGASVGGLDPKQISTSSSSSLMLSKCVECSATFDNDDDLDCHVTAAHYLSLATEFGCTSCLKLFARPDDLQKHLMDVHAHHLYRCTLCKQVFDSKASSCSLTSLLNTSSPWITSVFPG
jgi:hypothetical protein